MDRTKAMEAFGRLLDVMDRLRDECPWDREQTMESLRPLTIEETYELSEAVLARDNYNISKELGDLLLHIVFYAKIGDEQNSFDITKVIDLLCDKLIFRHPHVFSDQHVSKSEEVVKNWEQLKGIEKGGNRSLLAGVPNSMPSLVKAYRIQDKARAVGFDWKERGDVWAKVKEELMEFEAELLKNESTNDENLLQREGEFGDLLFSLVNAARLYNINPDSALEMTNLKFITRFNYIEKAVKQSGGSIKELSLEEMDKLWEEAKKVENGHNGHY